MRVQVGFVGTLAEQDTVWRQGLAESVPDFFIEGQRTATVEAGMAMDIYDAIDRRVFGYS